MSVELSSASGRQARLRGEEVQKLDSCCVRENVNSRTATISFIVIFQLAIFAAGSKGLAGAQELHQLDGFESLRLTPLKVFSPLASYVSELSQSPSIVKRSNPSAAADEPDPGSPESAATSSSSSSEQSQPELPDGDLIQAVESGLVPIEKVIQIGPRQQQVSRELDISMVQSADKKRPPIYMSAPKQIDGLSEISRASHGASLAPGDRARESGRSLLVESEVVKKSGDLHTAADGHRHNKKGKKRRHSYKKAKPKKKVVIVKKKKKKKKKPSYHHHQEQPQQEGSHQDHYGDHAGYYEYREVPKKGTWKYGYKRGNKKHTIERKEHGHKSHFKTEVKWKDKKGKGQHLFDYNHHDKKKKKLGYHAAAAAAASNLGQPQLVDPAGKPALAGKPNQIEGGQTNAALAGEGQNSDLWLRK